MIKKYSGSFFDSPANSESYLTAGFTINKPLYTLLLVLYPLLFGVKKWVHQQNFGGDV